MRKSMYLLSLLFLVAACSQGEEQEATTDEVSTEEMADTTDIEGEESKDEEAGIPGMALNDGEKWQANPETTAGINSMISRVEQFDAESDTAAYHNLADSLEADFQSIFKNCTMTGEAHNQLHNYLLPFKKMFPFLRSKGAAARKEGLLIIQEDLSKYDLYFE